MYGIVVDFQCVWRPIFIFSLCAAIFLGSVLFTLFCLYFIRPKFSQVLRGQRRPITIGKSLNNSPTKEQGSPRKPIDSSHPNSPTSTLSFTNSQSPKIKTLGKIQYHSLEEDPTKTSNEQV